MCDVESLTKIFKEFDTDGSGQIDIKELRGMVKVYFETIGVQADPAMIKDTVYDLLKNLDDDGDGTISLDEWLQLAKDNKTGAT